MLKIMTFKNLTVLAATAALVAVGYNASAQEDLDDLLNDLTGEASVKKDEVKAPAPQAEAPAPVEANEVKAIEAEPVKEETKAEEPA